MNIKDIFYKGASAILICLQIFTTYVGFVAFFYASLQIVFSYVLALISNCLSSDWFAFISNIFWLFASIPYIHLIVVINAKSILSFFKNIWKSLDLEKAENRLRQYFQHPKWCDKKYRVDRWGFFYLFAVFMNLIFLIIELITTTEQTVCSLAFAGLSCYPPLFSVIYILVKSIPLFKQIHSSDIGVLTKNFYESEDTNKNDDIDSVNQNLNDVSNEEEEGENKVKKWQVYFDPSQIIIQNEMLDFIKDPTVNNYGYLYYSHYIIPSFFITAIFIEYICYVIYKFVSLGKIRDIYDVIFFAVRIVYSLLSFRFLIIFNPINYIINFWRIKGKHTFVWFSYLVATAIAILIPFIAGVVMFIVYYLFTPINLNNFQYSPVYKNVTFDQQSSICQTNFYNLNLIEYSAIASLGQSKNITIAKEILKMVFPNRTFPIITNDNPISYMYTIQFNETLYLRSFESLTDRAKFSFMFDLFANDFVINRLSYGTIPFYYVAIDIFLYRYLSFLKMILNRYLLMNLIQNTAYFANSLYDVYDKVNFRNATIIYIGHSIGGLIAKGISSRRNVPSVAFESLEYYRSLFHMSVNIDSFTEFSSQKMKILNVFSPSQLFSEAEDTSAINVILPEWREIYQFVNAYDTFCMIAAGCATDARYDQFCDSVIGRDNFHHLFKLWNRSRSDDINGDDL